MNESEPPKELYTPHLTATLRAAEEALAATDYETLFVGAGAPLSYFADDQEAVFRTNPYFAHFVPLAGPHHVLCIEPGRKPLLFFVRPRDYWVEHASLSDDVFWADCFDIQEVEHVSDIDVFSKKKNAAYIGNDAPSSFPRDAVNPASLIAHLDWRRSFKTGYEVACIKEANHAAAHAHEAARDAFYAGACELEIHEAFLEELAHIDGQLPYPPITALDEKCSILHYQGKRLIEDGKSALIDAGASYLGYASDITRSYASDSADFLFRGLLGGMESVQQELVDMALPGVSFPELHHAAHVKIGRLLRECGMLTISGEDAAAEGLTRAFFPHGLGHFLGLTVHDVGGSQKDASGAALAAPEEYPKLRMTRVIEPGMVFTIEPGIYFIDMLLQPHREGNTKQYFNWDIVDRLKVFGGVRIEDDILATENGNENLTRKFLR